MTIVFLTSLLLPCLNHFLIWGMGIWLHAGPCICIHMCGRRDACGGLSETDIGCLPLSTTDFLEHHGLFTQPGPHNLIWLAWLAIKVQRFNCFHLPPALRFLVNVAEPSFYVDARD